VVPSPARYRLNGPGEGLHIHHRRGVAQLDRPRVVLSSAAVARGHALSLVVHHTELADGVGLILRRGLLDPWQRLRVVHIHTVAIVVHGADLVLAESVNPLSTDLVRRHRSREVDRHALPPEVDVANEHGCIDVALVWGEASAIAKVVRLRAGKASEDDPSPLT